MTRRPTAPDGVRIDAPDDLRGTVGGGGHVPAGAPVATARLTARIEGMRCVHCVRAVTTALAGVEGITSADVAIGSATIEHDGHVTLDTVRQAVAVAGYEVGGGTEERRRLPVL